MKSNTVPASAMLPAEKIEQIKARKKMAHQDIVGYVSRGGTYLIAVGGAWTDTGTARVLVAISVMGEVLALSPTVNPYLVQTLKEQLA